MRRLEQDNSFSSQSDVFLPDFSLRYLRVVEFVNSLPDCAMEFDTGERVSEEIDNMLGRAVGRTVSVNVGLSTFDALEKEEPGPDSPTIKGYQGDAVFWGIYVAPKEINFCNPADWSSGIEAYATLITVDAMYRPLFTLWAPSERTYQLDFEKVKRNELN